MALPLRAFTWKHDLARKSLRRAMAGFYMPAPSRPPGHFLIINPAGGYNVVIAGMDRIQATQGQFVLAGEPVAVMGSETRSGEKTPARPTLYVEFRRDQQSIDPAPWWSAGGKG